MVRTDGPDGKLTDYEIARTFGVWPLQQYMIAFPGGRYQMLGIAWDARTKAEGGQRWFHLTPDEKMDHKDPLHWTGRYQNWNLQCAACHSTHLKKGYDAASDSYKTTFSEINVACEACHGPASRHTDWAKQARAPYAPGADKGLVVLKSRWKEAWSFATPGAPSAQRDRPADEAAANTCAACHARRSTLVEHGATGAPLLDTHRPALLTPPTYFADGQQRDEVFVWNSFLQTRMHQKGVTCMDCHDAHSLKLQIEGNTLCARCHNAAVFDAPKHHGHKAGSKGAQCVECHMPERNYMVVDARRDHAIRVPRPDLSDKLGTPDACTRCHADRKPQWAAAAMDGWYGTGWRARPQTGSTLHAGATQGVSALPSLMALAEDPALAPIVRATALTLAQPHLQAQALPALRKLLAHTDPLLRASATGSLEPFDPPTRVAAAAPLLADPVRGVRVEAARVLADVPDEQIPMEWRSARGEGAQGIRGLADRGCGLAVVQRQPGQPALAPGPGGRGHHSLSAGPRCSTPSFPRRLPQPGRRLPAGPARRRRRKDPARGHRPDAAQRGSPPCAGPAAGAQGRQARRPAVAGPGGPAGARQRALCLRAGDRPEQPRQTGRSAGPAARHAGPPSGRSGYAERPGVNPGRGRRCQGRAGLCRKAGGSDARRSVGATPSGRSEGSRRTLKVAPRGQG
jgi:hypothetical protein